MRKLFAEMLYKEMENCSRIEVLVGDVGYGMFDKIKERFGSRFHNVGAAEQLMIGAGIGMALSGKIPVCYSITPFLLYRPFELIRNYLYHENISVKLVGSGRDKEYERDGISHWAEEDAEVMYVYRDVMKRRWPQDANGLTKIFNDFLYDGSPWYLNLSRKVIDVIPASV